MTRHANPRAAQNDLSRTQRLNHWIRNSPPVLILGLLAFIITTAIAVTGPITNAVRWYRHTYDWKQTDIRHAHEPASGIHSRPVHGEPWLASLPTALTQQEMG